MPAIRDQVLDCSFYLYPSIEDAEQGGRFGGCGFIIGAQMPNHPEMFILYAVTARHVVENGARTLRLNTRDGKVDVRDTQLSDWILSETDDVAISLIDLEASRHRFHFFPSTEFITSQQLRNRRITIGDDVVLVGRFVSHGGRQSNHPTVRFGNIAMMPVEPIWMGDNDDGTQRFQDGYLVEIRSIPGYSGSAVFYHDPRRSDPPKVGQLMATHWLLGVDVSHIAQEQYVQRFDGVDWVDDENQRIISNTGMAIVVPSCKIIDMLKAPECKKKIAHLEMEHER
jgi:hypothetical protein